MKSFAVLLEEFRDQSRLSKKDLTQRTGLSSGYISLLTRGDRKDPSEKTVALLADALKLDTESRIRLFEAAGYSSSTALAVSRNPILSSHQDWGDAPNVQFFYGRTHELEKLQSWIVKDRCQLVAIQGIGGVGKTMLAARLANAIQSEFDHLLWRTLHNSPPLENILKDCIQFFSTQRFTNLPEDADNQISLLLEQLRKHRCLIILDNFESVLLSSSSMGQYKAGYERYGKLLQYLGQAKHNSCLLLTSREMPKEIIVLEGVVKAFSLRGLETAEGKEILKDKGLRGTEKNWQDLINYYAGNPLALKVAAHFIKDVFDSDIAHFLGEEGKTFQDVREVLDQQFNRLSPLEIDIMSWLAIEREPLPSQTLMENILRPLIKRDLIEALNSLKRRSLIESRGTDLFTVQSERRSLINNHGVALFTLQPVIMEYMTDKLVDQIRLEIIHEKPTLLIHYALMKAQAKDYIRNMQSRLILEPIARRPSSDLEQGISEQNLANLLSCLKEMPSLSSGYAAGNVLNLLIQLRADLRNYDFSNLTIHQAYLRGAALPGVNFSSASFVATVFTETFGSILSVALSPEALRPDKQQLLAAGTVTGEIRTWQVSSRTPHLTFSGHENWVWSVTFSPDGKMLASGSDDQTVRVWDVNTGQCLTILREHVNRVRSVVFSPIDRHLLASSSEDGTLRLWNIRTGRCLDVLEGHGEQVYSIAFSPNGHQVVSGHEDGIVRVWEINTKQFQELPGHRKRIYAVAWSPDEQTLASGSEDGTVRLWEASTGRCRAILEEDKQVYAVAFNHDSSLLASGNENGTIALWEVETGQQRTILSKHSNRIYALAFSSYEELLASGSNDQTVKLWDTKTQQCVDTLQGYTNLVWSVAFSPDGKLLAGGSNDKIVRLWDVNMKAYLNTLQGHSDRVRSVVFSPDGQILASGSEDRTVRLWEIHTGQCFAVLEGHSDRVRSVVFSPDGQILASGSEDGTVRLWKVKTGQRFATLKAQGDQIYAIAFNADGQILASGSEDGTIVLWDVSKNVPINILHAHSNRIYALAFSPDGHLLASGSNDQTVKLWDVRTGQCQITLTGHNNRIYAVAFSPHGELLASGSNDQTVKLWDVRTGQCQATLQGPDIWIYSIAFNPKDGQYLASGGDKGIVTLWDTQTNQPCKLLRSERPYEGMNITGVKGLTSSQQAVLKALGAIENKENIPL